MGYKAKREMTTINFVNGRQDMKTSVVYHEQKCKKCGCDTRSHEYSDGTVMCHKCWLKEEAKKEAEKSQQPLTPPSQEKPEVGSGDAPEGLVSHLGPSGPETMVASNDDLKPDPKPSDIVHIPGTEDSIEGDGTDKWIKPVEVKCPKCGSVNFHRYHDSEGVAEGEECDDCDYKAGDV